MPSEIEGKLTLGLTPTSKGPKLVSSIDRPADLKLTLKQCSNRGNYTILEQEKDDIRGRQLAQGADLTCMIIYDVFLIPWTFAYQ